MLRDIIRKEILDNILSPKFISTFLLCTVLVLLSIYTGVTNYTAEKKEYDASVALNRKIMEGATGYLEVRSAITVYKPPQVLGTIVNGVEEAVGRSASPGGSSEDSNLTDSKYESNPIFAVFGALDLMFIVKIVLSLFAILFTFDSIVGEKENGTLKLTLANDVPRDRLILGKAIGSFISLLMPLLIPLVLSLIILMFVPSLALSSSDWLRIFFIFLMFFVYLLVFFSLGLFVSTRTSRSSTSFLILLCIWVVFVMIIPKGAAFTANRIKPIPSIHEITAKKRAFAYQLSMGTLDRMQEMEKQLEARHMTMGEMLEEIRNETARKVEEHNGALERDYQLRKKAQQNLAINLSRISPASALTFGSMSLARTGIEECDRFLASVRIYNSSFEKWYNSKAFSSNTRAGQPPGVDLSDMPQHVLEPESLRNSIVRALPDFALMIAMTIIFFVGGYVSFLRYDVR